MAGVRHFALRVNYAQNDKEIGLAGENLRSLRAAFRLAEEMGESLG